MNFLFVALGGAVGAMTRYAISLIPLKTEFPFLTLITNVIGAILIGFIVGITSARDGVSKNMVLFWKTGVCGAGQHLLAQLAGDKCPAAGGPRQGGLQGGRLIWRAGPPPGRGGGRGTHCSRPAE